MLHWTTHPGLPLDRPLLPFALLSPAVHSFTVWHCFVLHSWQQEMLWQRDRPLTALLARLAIIAPTLLDIRINFRGPMLLHGRH